MLLYFINEMHSNLFLCNWNIHVDPCHLMFFIICGFAEPHFLTPLIDWLIDLIYWLIWLIDLIDLIWLIWLIDWLIDLIDMIDLIDLIDSFIDWLIHLLIYWFILFFFLIEYILLQYAQSAKSILSRRTADILAEANCTQREACLLTFQVTGVTLSLTSPLNLYFLTSFIDAVGIQKSPNIMVRLY